MMKRTISNNQNGMVSIIVTMIMIIIISLVVLALGQVTRRNQQEALNNQLAAQAYYAAESGVNDATAKLLAGYLPSPTDATNCTNFITSTSPATPTPLNNKIDGNNVGYTCLLVNNQPPKLHATVSKSNAVVVPISPSGSGGAGTGLSFTWAEPSGVNIASCASFEPAVAWGNCPAVLRVDIYADDGTYDADHLATQTATVFFVPTAVRTPQMVNGGSVYSIRAGCTGAQCTGTLNGLNSGPFVDGKKYYARITSIYSDAGTIEIAATNGSTRFVGSQIVIDSTGHAQNQLKRIQETLQVTPEGKLPVNALSSASGICKVYNIAPGVDLGNGVGNPDDTPGDCN